MKKLTVLLLAVAGILSGCVVYPFPGYYRGEYRHDRGYEYRSDRSYDRHDHDRRYWDGR